MKIINFLLLFLTSCSFDAYSTHRKISSKPLPMLASVDCYTKNETCSAGDIYILSDEIISQSENERRKKIWLSKLLAQHLMKYNNPSSQIKITAIHILDFYSDKNSAQINCMFYFSISNQRHILHKDFISWNSFGSYTSGDLVSIYVNKPL